MLEDYVHSYVSKHCHNASTVLKHETSVLTFTVTVF
jgi:hypothetical protein